MSVDARSRRLLGVAVASIVGAALVPLSPAAPAVAAGRLCGPPADTVPPVLSNVSFSTQTVDVSSGPQPVTVTADASDAAGTGNGSGSGIKRLELDFSGPRSYVEVKMSLSTGTATAGTWQGTLTVPQDGRDGTWTLRDATARDVAGNYQIYSNEGKHPDSPTDIRLQAGWDQSFTVTGSTPPPPPTKPGTLTKFSLEPRSVDTTEAAKSVHVSATFAAPLPETVRVFFSSKSRNIRSVGATLKPKSNGRWSGHVRVHQWVGDTTLLPQLFVEYGADAKPRFKDISSTQLHARHLPDRVTVTSDTDKTRPVLQTLTFTPSSVDTTTGPQTMTVTATASDSQSGVAEIDANLFKSVNEKVFPGGFDPGFGYDPGNNVSVSLTQNGDQWTGQVTFRRCVPAGTWHATVFVQDHAQNAVYYAKKKLTAAGLPSTVSVTSTKGDIEPPEVENSTASGADHAITLDFSEGVKNVSPSTLSVFASKPAATRFAQASTISAITCSNGTTTIDCSGDGGLVTSAQLLVPDLAAGAAYQVWANLGAITSQLTDGAGNPLSWNNSVTDVTGS